MAVSAEDVVLAQACREAEASSGRFVLSLGMDVATAAYVVGALYLSLKHPEFGGRSALVVQGVVDAVIDRLEAEGFANVAALLRRMGRRYEV